MDKPEPKYSKLCSEVREKSEAAAVVLMVLGGNLGSGFVVLGDDDTLAMLPDFLETVAADVRKQRLQKAN